MTVKYIHLRLCARSAARGVYPASKGGATVAYEVSPGKSPDTSIRYAIALCNKKDHYNKSIGRLIAGGRLLAQEGVVVIDTKEGKTVVAQILEHLSDI